MVRSDHWAKGGRRLRPGRIQGRVTDFLSTPRDDALRAGARRAHTGNMQRAIDLAPRDAAPADGTGLRNAASVQGLRGWRTPPLRHG